MKLFIHSFSDVITNSSESIYVSANEKSIDLVKELINYFLQKAGSDKTADDLFTFELELDEAYVERILDDKSEEQLESLSGKELPKMIEELYETIRRLVKDGKIDPSNYDCNHSKREDSLIITPKDGSKEFDIASKLRSIFKISAIWNG